MRDVRVDSARRLCLVLRPVGRGFSGHFDLQPTLTPCTNLGSVLRYNPLSRVNISVTVDWGRNYD